MQNKTKFRNIIISKQFCVLLTLIAFTFAQFAFAAHNSKYGFLNHKHNHKQCAIYAIGKECKNIITPNVPVFLLIQVFTFVYFMTSKSFTYLQLVINNLPRAPPNYLQD